MIKKSFALLAALLLIRADAGLLWAAEVATLEGVEVSSDTVTINTDQPIQYESFTTAEPPRIVMELLNTQLKENEPSKHNGSGQYLKAVTTQQYTSSPLHIARVVLQLAEKSAYEIVANGKKLMVMLKTAPEDENAPVKKAKFTAAAPMAKDAKPVDPNRGYVDILRNLPTDKISLEYEGADIRSVLDTMGEKIGVNMVYSDDIAGELTIRLNQVPFNEAFSTILAIKSLSAVQLGSNILQISTAKSMQNEQATAQMTTRIFPVNYIKAEEAKTTIENVISAEGRKGKVNFDAVSNSLIVTDVPSGLETIGQVIRQIDQKPRQVLIEAKLVEVNLNNSFSLGVNWSAYGSGTSGNGTNFFGSGSTASQAVVTGGGSTQGLVIPYDGSQTIYQPLPNSASSGGTGVTFPTSSSDASYGAFRFGRITNNYFLDATISAGQQKGKVKVLSDPKVSTINNKEAKINITTQIPYTTTQTTNSNPPISTTIVTYITTGIELTVTPSITLDGKILMVVNPSVSQKATTVATAAGGAPGVDTRSAKTTVLTRDGETIVIGGLIYDSVADTTYKIPLLGDIPILGWLFKKKTDARQRIELLIFVTPKIID